jgi:hypothetical protein
MNKLNYAVAMLTAAGGSAVLAPSAQAAVLYGVFELPGYTESFDIQTTGTPDAISDYTDFALSNDSLGNTFAIVGDDTTGLKGSGADSYFGTSSSSSSPLSQTQTYTSLKPALYSASDPTPVLLPGLYASDFVGPGSLLLSTVPEPEAWALLIAGAAMTGGALRVSRRRSRLATA